jgi:glycosyltransferase involved in cell wall biosynthesis
MSGRVQQAPTCVALLTHGFDIGGGVPTVARWLRDGLHATGHYEVEILDLATSRHDEQSRRLAKPRTWAKRSLRSDGGQPAHQRWGANAVELEPMRYRPRHELTTFLRRFDIIQVVSGTPAWAAVARHANRPVVVQAATAAAWERQAGMHRQSRPLRHWRTAMTRRTSAAERLAVTHADAVMVENEQMFAYVRNLGHRNVHLAPPGVDTDTYRPHPAAWQRDGYLLSLCRLGDGRKGLDRMVRAYGAMVSADSQVPRLVLAGRGSLERLVTELITKLDLADRISVRPDVPEEEIPALYRHASAFLQTSHEEGLGLSLLQAMASGLPVIATETAGSAELVVEGQTGYLVSQRSEADLPGLFADRTRRVVRFDGQSMAERARQRCLHHFSSQVTLRRFTDVYDQLLATGDPV